MRGFNILSSGCNGKASKSSSPCLLDHILNHILGDLVLGTNCDLSSQVWLLQKPKAPVSHKPSNFSKANIEAVRFRTTTDQTIGLALSSPIEVVHVALSGAALVESLGEANRLGVVVATTMKRLVV